MVREDDAKDASTAADDLVSQLGSATPKLVTLFASRESRSPRPQSRRVLERLPKGTRLIGASTGGEIDRGGMSEGEVVLGALSGDFASVSASAPALARRTRRRLGAVSRACYELGVRRRTRRKEIRRPRDGRRVPLQERRNCSSASSTATRASCSWAAERPTRARSVEAVAVLPRRRRVVTDAALIALFRTDRRGPRFARTGRADRHHAANHQGRRHAHACSRDRRQTGAQRYADILGVTVDDLEFGTPNGFATHRRRCASDARTSSARLKPLPDGSILFANLLEGGQRARPDAHRRHGRIREGSSNRISPTCGEPARGAALPLQWAQVVREQRRIIPSSRTRSPAAPPCVGLNVHFEIYCGSTSTRRSRRSFSVRAHERRDQELRPK